MASSMKGNGYFTAENIVAVLRVLPETNGTYDQIIERTKEHGVDLPKHALSRWVASGRADIRAGKHQTAFARFAQRFDQIRKEHCGPETKRTRELDRALEVLDRTCECGNEKALEADGKLADQCLGCQDIDPQTKQYRRAG